MRTPLRYWYWLIPLAVVWTGVVVAAEESQFVAKGTARDTRVLGQEWVTQQGALVCSGKGNVLYAGKQCGPGDFQIHVRLTIDGLNKSAASVVINGSHFGFEGNRGTMFTEGALFGSRDLGAPVVNTGELFTFTARRRGDSLTIAIDGEPVLQGKLPTAHGVEVGLRPWRSTMRVVEFTAVGSLVAPPRPLPHVEVFRSGTGNYHTYRIPAIVTTRQGTLLAFAEGRKTGRGDAGNIDLLVRRSMDGGDTWSNPAVVWDDGPNTCGNPCPVVDLDTGKIWLLMTWNLGSDHERQIMAGTSQDVRHVYVTQSSDDGRSWAAPRKISDQVRKPHWRWYATGPGNAIQLTSGPHRGRLLIPANHSDHADPARHPYRSHVFWSDDHGISWQLGGIQEERTNESALVELAGGRVLQSMRSYHEKGLRAGSVSDDGGKTWGKVVLDEALKTPVCQANVLRYSWPDEKTPPGRSRVLFCSPTGPGRTHLTVWVSYDEGRHWPIRRLIHAGGSAYSNLVRLPGRRIGVLYEKDGYRTIELASFTLEWLEAD